MVQVYNPQGSFLKVVIDEGAQGGKMGEFCLFYHIETKKYIVNKIRQRIKPSEV